MFPEVRQFKFLKKLLVIPLVLHIRNLLNFKAKHIGWVLLKLKLYTNYRGILWNIDSLHSQQHIVNNSIFRKLCTLKWFNVGPLLLLNYVNETRFITEEEIKKVTNNLLPLTNTDIKTNHWEGGSRQTFNKLPTVYWWFIIMLRRARHCIRSRVSWA